MARIGTNMSVQVESTKATGLAVTAVTLVTGGGVATSSGHGLSDGDVVVFDVSSGTVELDGQAVRCSATDTNTFTLEGLDTSAYTTWVSGTASKVTAWHTLSSAQTVSMPDGTPNKIDITTLIDKSRQYAYGLPEAPDGSSSGLYDPQNAGVLAIKAATKANTPLAFRINWAGGQYTIFNANVSGGSGFDLSQNDVATSTTSFTPVKDVLDYAS